MYVLVNKLRAVKRRLRKSHRGNYSDMHSRIELLQQQVEAMNRQCHADPSCVPTQRRLKELSTELVQLIVAEDSLARQQAKIKWLEQGGCKYCLLLCTGEAEES